MDSQKEEAIYMALLTLSAGMRAMRQVLLRLAPRSDLEVLGSVDAALAQVESLVRTFSGHDFETLMRRAGLRNSEGYC